MDTKFIGLSPEQLAVLGAAQAYKVQAARLKVYGNGEGISFLDQRKYGIYLIAAADVQDALTKLAEACFNLPDDE